jgi:hypothetical protein
LTDILRQTVEEFGIEYHENPNFLDRAGKADEKARIRTGLGGIVLSKIKRVSNT